MTFSEVSGSSPTEPMDNLDQTILKQLHNTFTTVDPMPNDLVERIQFALELDEPNFGAELVRLNEHQLASAVRGEEARTITFDSDSLTIMVSIQPCGAQFVRVDGWLAPPAPYRVELRVVGGERVTTADSDGRFVLTDIPHGPAQIVVRIYGEDWSQPPKSVIAPSIVV